MTERIERTQDLFLIDMTGEGLPAEEGQVRFVDSDIKAFVGGQVVSLITGTAIFDNIIIDDDGRIVYVGDGLFVMRG